jgi:predicted permease
MFRLVINIFFPALIFTAVSRVSIDRTLAVFPLTALTIITVGYAAGRLLATNGPFVTTQQAVSICCCMNVNTGFVLPFMQGLYGVFEVSRAWLVGGPLGCSRSVIVGVG